MRRESSEIAKELNDSIAHFENHEVQTLATLNIIRAELTRLRGAREGFLRGDEVARQEFEGGGALVGTVGSTGAGLAMNPTRRIG